MVEVAGVYKQGNMQRSFMKKVIIDNEEVLLAKVGGQYFAVQNRCAHLGGDLSQGKLEGYIVTCPRHGSQYDIRDGKVIRWTDWTGVKLSVAKALRPPRSLKTYKVSVEGERVLIESGKIPVKV